MDFELIFYWTLGIIFVLVVVPILAMDVVQRRQRRRERRNGRRRTDKIRL